MKATMESAGVVGSAASTGVYLVKGGKVQKSKAKRETTALKEVHSNGQEMKEYLSKLQDIVPYMPKNKRLSKVEVISYVIDYIHTLRETLGLPPCTAMDDCCLEEEESSVTTCSEVASAESCSAFRTCTSALKVGEESKKQDPSECRVFSGEE